MSLYRIARTATGLFYLVGGPLIHGYFMTFNRHIYAAIGDQAWWGYRAVWDAWVLPNLLPLVSLLVVFEMATGLAMLGRPRLAQFGQAAGCLFNLLLVPFFFGLGLPNLLLVALHLWLWGEEHSRARMPAATPATGGTF